MTAKDFNSLTAEHAVERLSPLGFKKSGIHFYIYQAPNLMVFRKETFRGMFEGFYLALTHDFLPYTRDNNGKVKIPPYLENYPFSISLKALKDQYTKHGTVADFTYDTNFLTRVVLGGTSRTDPVYPDLLTFDTLQYDKQAADNYIKSSIDIVETQGMKLLSEFTPLISYFSVTRHKNINDTMLNQFRAELEKYLADNNITIPRR